MTLCRNSMVPLLEENKPRKVSYKEVPLFLLCDQGAWHCIGQLKSSVRANKMNSKNSHRTLLSCLPAIANTLAVMASLLTIKPESVIRDLIPHNLITITISLRYVVASTLPSYAWLTLFQCNTNRNLMDICGQNHLELPNTTSGSSTQIDKLGTMHNIHKGHTRPHQTSASGPKSTDPKTLQSLVQLEWTAMSQTEAMQAFKGWALGLSPTRALLDEIKAHQMGLEAMLAAITVLWCQNGSRVMSVKEGLRRDLWKSIKEINNVKQVLTTTARAITTCRTISAEKPSEYLSHEHTTHTDLNDRQRLYSLLGRM